MTLYELLISKQKKRPSFSSTVDYAYFAKNKSHLSKFPRFASLADTGDEFDIIRLNILLAGYNNKVMIEEEIANINNYIHEGQKIDHIKLINTIKEKMLDEPYLMDEKNKIYIPFFSRSLNQLYVREPEKLLEKPYSDLKDNFSDSIVDPGDTYGAALFDSLYTRLLKVGNKGDETAYFHYDTNTIYFVNKQGRMDNKLVLFDKYIKNPSYNHMMERIRGIVDCYFNNDRSGMINALYQNGFISNRILSLINKNSRK